MIKPEQIPDEVVEAAAMQLPGMAGHQRYVRAAIAAAAIRALKEKKDV